MLLATQTRKFNWKKVKQLCFYVMQSVVVHADLSATWRLESFCYLLQDSININLLCYSMTLGKAEYPATWVNLFCTFLVL